MRTAGTSFCTPPLLETSLPARAAPLATAAGQRLGAAAAGAAPDGRGGGDDHLRADVLRARARLRGDAQGVPAAEALRLASRPARPS